MTVWFEHLMGHCFSYFVTAIKPTGLAEIIHSPLFRGTPLENYSLETA